MFTPQLWDRNGSGTQPDARVHTCSTASGTSRPPRDMIAVERVRLALWCERATGPVPEPFQLPRDIRRFPARSSYLQTAYSDWSGYLSWSNMQKKCPTALILDDLDTPRAPVQIMLFVAVLFIQRSPGAPQTLFRNHNFDELITRW